MKAVWALALSSLSLVTAACTNFPTIPSGECGNGVIDPKEDCDTFAPYANAVCRPKGTAGECHLDCSFHGSERAPCRVGWGCDGDAICRAPSGQFEKPSPALDVGAWSLAAGDFDGDGRADVMSLEPLGPVGTTRVKFFYFDAQGALAETRSFPSQIISPAITQLPSDDDALCDLTFSEGPIGVMHGRADRTWIPETFTSYRATDVSVRITAVNRNRVEGSSPFLPLFSYAGSPDFPGGSGFFAIDSESGKLKERAHIAGLFTDLAGDPASGNVLEDTQTSPCLEPVYALRGARQFTIVNVCQTDAQLGVIWRKPFEQTDIALDPPAAIDAAPQYVDLNSDGHLDVLLGAGGKPYIAYGDGRSLAAAVPYRLSLANPSDVSPDIPMPVAAGDFTGDGAPDFVFSDHLLVSSRSDRGALPFYSAAIRNRLGAPITSAKIADFNGNGKLDVVTASGGSLNLEFFNGTGGPGLTPVVISTAAPVASLSLGDFDGDGITDLALLEVPRAFEVKNAIKIAYGRPSAPLSEPSTVAQVFHAEQLESVDDSGLSSLVIASSDEVDGQLNGALTLLTGAGDRVPFAPFALTEFASNGNVQDSVAIAVAAGAFTGRGQGDLVALAFSFPEPKSPNPPLLSFWVLPAVDAPGTYPRLLTPALDGRLQPTTFFDRNADLTVDAASAAADLNGDGLDDAIFVMPAGADRQQCGLLTLSVALVSKNYVLDAHEPLILDEPCPDPVLVPVDADGDGFIDLALLTGVATPENRQLSVLWNDGRGGFSSSNRALVSAPNDSPQAFSVLRTPGARRPAFSYVTHDLLQRVPPLTDTREFSAPDTLLDQLQGATGIVAADLNGDGVTDLALAESGKLRVLKAELLVP